MSNISILKQSNEVTVLLDGSTLISQRKLAELININPSTLMNYVSKEHRNTNTSNGLDEETALSTSTYFAFESKVSTQEARDFVKKVATAGIRAFNYHLAGYQVEAKPSEQPAVSHTKFEQELLGAKYAAEILAPSENSKLAMLYAVHENNGVSTYALPNYTENVRVKDSATQLLINNGCSSDLSLQAFNRLMVSKGLLEERVRRSSGGETKKYKALTEAGKKWGENETHPKSPNQVQPRYYVDTFMDLFDLLMGS